MLYELIWILQTKSLLVRCKQESSQKTQNTAVEIRDIYLGLPRTYQAYLQGTKKEKKPRVAMRGLGMALLAVLGSSFLIGWLIPSHWLLVELADSAVPLVVELAIPVNVLPPSKPVDDARAAVLAPSGLSGRLLDPPSAL